MMDKDAFFSGLTLKTGTATLDNGSEIPIQELSARQRGELSKLAGDKNPVRAQCRVIVMGCPMFDEKDVDRLMDIPGAAVARISDAILELSGLGDEAKDDAKNV